MSQALVYWLGCGRRTDRGTVTEQDEGLPPLLPPQPSTQLPCTPPPLWPLLEDNNDIGAMLTILQGTPGKQTFRPAA